MGKHTVGDQVLYVLSDVTVKPINLLICCRIL